MTDDVRVTSSDGTVLSARVTGSGPPLVLVHGTTGTKDSWAFVEPALAEHHTVWSYDRRGRGGSGDAETYGFEREIDDLRSVVAAAGGPVHLVGHSFGARCAADLAPDIDGLGSLVLYEPPVHLASRTEAIAVAVGHLATGRVEDGVVEFFRHLAGFSDEELEMVRSLPSVWDRFLSTAPTAAREVRALQSRTWDPAALAGVSGPVVFLAGAATELDVYPTADEVGTIDGARHVELPGQRHIAFATDPALFSSAVLAVTNA